MKVFWWLGILFIISVWSFLGGWFVGNQQSLAKHQYRDSASDGWYVQEPYLFNATAVWFPIDKHYDGVLLGWWRLADDVNMTQLSGNMRGLYCFYLEGNVITEAYLLKVWNMTSGEWQQ